MIVRQASEKDTSAIIDLLKSALGETLVKKTAAIWNFKHKANPFGPSYVLIAEEAGLLTGVRALMQWQWQLRNEVWYAGRAVDTATHSKHQGRGIFKRLTLQALETFLKNKDAFIFNTPNNKSQPGYLKMGWHVVGKIQLALTPAPFYWFLYPFSKNEYVNSISDDRLEELCALQNDQLAKQSVLFTPKSAAYLRWRYEENPMQEYNVFSSSNWYLAVYIKKHRYFNELRVVEFISTNTKQDRKEIREILVKMSLRKSCLFITSAYKNLLGLSIYGKFGPQLTFKALTNDPRLMKYSHNINNWYYHLGDLELF